MSVRTSAAIAVSILSLSAGSVGLASADSSNLVPLEIDPICVVSASNQAYFSVYNKNSSDVTISWTADDNANTGSYDAPATSTTDFAVYYDATDPNNTTTFSDAADTTAVSRNTGNNECQPGQVTITTGSTGTVSSGSGTGTVSSGSGTVSSGSGDTTPVVGGLGGGDTTAATITPAATTTVATVATPELADTGASRLMPLTAAAVIALFTVATSVLVRKNVL